MFRVWTILSVSAGQRFFRFVCDLRRRRRGSALSHKKASPVLERLWLEKNPRRTIRQHLSASMLNLCQRVETTQPTNTKAHLKPDARPKTAHGVHTATKLQGRKPADPLRTQTSHVSFPLRTLPGTRCPGPCDSLMPPLPTPSPAGRDQIHTIR